LRAIILTTTSENRINARNHGRKDPVKIPKMPKAAYDSVIKRQQVSRIAFGACEHPYVALFMNVFDGKYLYFLSAKDGRKIEYFKNNPNVSVGREEYAPDLSAFCEAGCGRYDNSSFALYLTALSPPYR
jgi:hypothetical protein